MRVATYTQATATTRGSVFALLILLGTILLGTGVLPTVMAHVGGSLSGLITPMWILLYLGALGGLMFSHGINWISWLVRYRILLVLLITGTLLSISWSIDTQLSVERSIHLFGSTLIAIFIGFAIPLLTTLRIFAVVLGLTMVASVVTAIAIPEIGLENYEGTQVWSGVYNSKNDLGFWAAIGVLLYVTLSDSLNSAGLKFLCFLTAGLCLALLGLSQSATSLLALLVAGSLCLYLFIASRFQLGFIRMSVLAAFFIALTGLAIANIETAELVGRSGDLTGRGEVWSQTWQLIMDRPLTGYGYGALWFPNDASMWIQETLMDFTWVVHHAHNGLLHIASEIGIPLALIAVLMVAQQLIEIFYCQYERKQVGVLFVLGFAIAFLVSNYSEARFLVNRELYWMFFLALPISMLRQITLTEEAVSGDRRSPEHEASAADGTPAWQPVPGKPWLGPTPAEQIRMASGNAAVASAATTAATAAADSAQLALPLFAEDEEESALAHNRAPDLNLDLDLARTDTDSTGEHSLELDNRSLPLNFADTDIDLGSGLPEGGQDDTGSFDDSLDFTAEKTAEQEDTPDLVQSRDVYSLERVDRSFGSAEIFDEDDNFGDDRYDIDLDITGDWIELPLEEEELND